MKYWLLKLSGLMVVGIVFLAVADCGSSDDDTVGDDDVTAGDDDTTVGDDDVTVGDDDVTAGDDDVTAGDDDVTAGDDDVTAGDDDASMGDDDVTSVESPTPVATPTATPGPTPYDVGEMSLSEVGITNNYGSVELLGEVGGTSLGVQLDCTSEIPDHCADITAKVSFKGGGAYITTYIPPGIVDAVVDLAVLAPAELPASIVTRDGDIVATSMSAGLAASASGGNISGMELMGNVDATTNYGTIDVETAIDAGGNINAGVLQEGDINLRIPTNTSAQFTAAAPNGTITVNNLTGILVVGGNSANGTLGEGDGTITLNTQMGNIAVTGTSD